MSWLNVRVQIVPLLSVGLGINNFLILLAALEQTLRDQDDSGIEHTTVDTIGKAMSTGGMSITLSSVASACVYFLANVLPVPGGESN